MASVKLPIVGNAAWLLLAIGGSYNLLTVLEVAAHLPGALAGRTNWRRKCGARYVARR